MYYSGQYVLNVKTDYEVDSCSKEISEIIFMLYKKANEKLKRIWRGDVHNASEDINGDSEEIVYTKTDAC